MLTYTTALDLSGARVYKTSTQIKPPVTKEIFQLEWARTNEKYKVGADCFQNYYNELYKYNYYRISTKKHRTPKQPKSQRSLLPKSLLTMMSGLPVGIYAP